MSKFLDRIKILHQIQAALPYAIDEITSKLDQGFKRPVFISMWYLDKEWIAAAQWWGNLITYNIRHLLDTDMEFLTGTTLKHELTHCLFLQYGLGVAFKEAYHLRFHENAAYYMGGLRFQPSVFFTYDDERGKGASLVILRRVLELKKQGKSTIDAKNQACKEARGCEWKVFQNIYIEKEYRERPRGTLIRHKDYEAWKKWKEEQKEKEKGKKSPAETPAKKSTEKST